jgi:hypothetical protein
VRELLTAAVRTGARILHTHLLRYGHQYVFEPEAMHLPVPWPEQGRDQFDEFNSFRLIAPFI